MGQPPDAVLQDIADFRKNNCEAVRRACREFVVLCRRLELFTEALRSDGSAGSTFEWLVTGNYETDLTKV